MMEEINPGENTSSVSEQTKPTPVVVCDVTTQVDKESNPDGGNEASGVWSWIKSASSNQFMQSVMKKTKTGVDKMITTLDPGMEPFIREGGDINVVVTSEKEVKWGAVRDAFQAVFGAATVVGVPAQSNIAPQPVGYTAGLKGAQERISYLRHSQQVDENQVCVSVENFVAEHTPDKWFDVGCIVLNDPVNKIMLEVYTLAVPVENEVILDMQRETPDNYDLSWSGLAVTVGEAIQKRLPWVSPSDWPRALTGMSRRNIIYSSSLCLAELYKRRLPEKVIEQNV
ncbi:protein PRRC1 [Ciona intestinalis]